MTNGSCRSSARESELERLVSALEDISEGAGRFLEIRGETGIGKSRLVEELVSRADVPVTQARCGRYAGSTPYFPFRTLISDLVGGDTVETLAARVHDSAPELDPYIPLLALTLGHTAPPTKETERLSAPDQRKKLCEVMGRLVRALSSRPRIWVVEDAQWIDPASSDVLRHLAAEAGSLPLLVCIAGRGDGADPHAADPEQVLELAPLSDEAAHDLLRAAATAHLLPRELERLTERSHGNPYFLIELAAVVSTRRDLDHLPDSLEALLASKIDALEPSERLVLRQLAVVGSRFDAQIAGEAVRDLPAIDDTRWDRLDEFIDRSSHPWRFRQTVVRDAAYEGLSYKERKEVHERAGAAIERNADDASLVCELLSLHFHAAGHHAKSLQYSNAAAGKASKAFALAEAATFYARSTDAARGTGDETALGQALTGLAHAEVDQGHYASARPHFEESLGIKRRLGDVQGVAAQLSGLGTVARQLGEYDDAHRLYEESLELLRGIDETKSLGSALRNIGTIAWLKGDYAEARCRFEESLEIFERNDDLSGVAASLETLGTVAFVMGDLEDATSRYEQSVAIQRQRGDKQGLATGLNNLGNAAFQAGRLTLAGERYDESLALRRELGDRYGVSSALTNLGTVAYFEKDYDGSRSYYEEALGIGREIGDLRGVSQCLHNLSEIAIVDTEPLQARGLCEEALRIRRELGDLRGVAESLTTLGNLAADTGEYARARPLQLEALNLLHELGNKPGLAECLEAVAVTCAALGDAVLAATLLGAVDAILDASGSAHTWSDEKRTALEATLRDELHESVADATIEAGRSLSVDASMELARSFLSSKAEASSASA